MLIRAADPRIIWNGTVSLQHSGHSVKPWRLNYEEVDFYYVHPLIDVASWSAGVRLSFETDADSIKLNFSHVVGSTASPGSCQIETTVNGKSANLVNVGDDEEYAMIDGLPPGRKVVEIWLPPNCAIEVHSLELPDDAVFEYCPNDKRQIVFHGSSITHCTRAHSPTRTWPALTAAAFGCNFTSMGFGGQCRLDHSVAATIREMSADVIIMKLGINALGDYSVRTFGPAVMGMVRTVRQKHIETPLVLCSPIYSPPREIMPSITGLNLETCRQAIAETVEIFRSRGDKNIYYIDGLKIFGPELIEYLPDELHPNADGIEIMGHNFIRELKKLELEVLNDYQGK